MADVAAPEAELSSASAQRLQCAPAKTVSLPGDLYSVRMRAADGGAHEEGGRHLSGAERLVPEEEVDAVALDLLRRARRAAHSAMTAGGVIVAAPPLPDFLQVTVERIPGSEVACAAPLRVTTFQAPGPGEARARAGRILREAGVGFDAIARAFDGLRSGMGPGGQAPRGAALFDRVTGERMDLDPARGVRASRFDYTPESRIALAANLTAHGLGHFRVAEALAVATKALWSGVRAEICWSDDADYVAGYVATPTHGYVRFPHFKPDGGVGGRVFFVEQDIDIDSLIDRLERRALLIEGDVEVTFE